MDALETLGDLRAHAEQARSLRGPGSGRARAVFLARDDDERHVFFRIFHGSVVDAHAFAVWQVLRHAAFAARQNLVANADDGEGAAHHHYVITAPRAVGVEIRRGHALFDEIASRRALRADAARGRDVIGGHRITEHHKHTRIFD